MTTPTDEARPKRIQRRRTKGWRMPEGTVYVGRPTKYGNPFRVGMNHSFADGYRPIATRAEAVALFRRNCYAQSGTYHDAPYVHAELRGKDLACWCPLDKPCHADVLLRIAND